MMTKRFSPCPTRGSLKLRQSKPTPSSISNAGLFLLALSLRQKDLPNLLHAHIGNSLQTAGNVRMRELLDGAPQLKVRDLDQIAALPLGSRVHLDPWSDKLELTKSNRVPLVLPRERMSFEVTPVYPYVTRMEGPDEKGKVVSEPPVK